ncbi:E3 ubiquitin-protein ligase RNF115-like [Olea europaea var. sylvestris]|uniref:E3 ubiquitin-protein ligase RNF115-like n=1 Tax=Olea europaea var. sylvestris TaxID=158386 RepID=UPI000C1D6915|nr:E3 ubiquitin-protein ligase RNF115-like [Olea europaea var. sylvestris]
MSILCMHSNGLIPLISIIDHPMAVLFFLSTRSSFSFSTSLLDITKDVEDEKSNILKKSSEVAVSPLQDEEDVCPTCLEEYDSENPKIITKCDHHFHLACILEWMERSDTCPVCDQLMVFSPVIGG